jgi:hypothetical protein
MKKTSAKKNASKPKKAAKNITAVAKSTVAAKPSDVPAMGKPVLKQPASKRQAAASAGIVLRTDDSWASPYFDPNDLRFLDRQLFG